MTNWTTPKTWEFDELVDESDLNTHIRDNLLYLKERIDLSGLVKRQGGSSTNWDTYGTTNYTPTSVKMQAGVINVPNVNTPAGSWYYGSSVITFPEAFTYNPLVLVSCEFAGTNIVKASVSSISPTQATIFLLSTTSATGVTLPVAWLAIGS
ncbi:MAG: hypothetical protein HRF47_12255 [Chloroflexota bacterium]|jgi:hypothetical protein